METFYDPLRRKAVAATPEERVRQWFISLLLEQSHVPAHMMASETGFRYGGKQYRADILIYDRNGAPLAVIECKRPDVRLGPDVVEQAMRYNIVLNVKWLVITNGDAAYVYRRTSDRFESYGSIPSYDEMLCQR